MFSVESLKKCLDHKSVRSYYGNVQVSVKIYNNLGQG